MILNSHFFFYCNVLLNNHNITRLKNPIRHFVDKCLLMIILNVFNLIIVFELKRQYV